MRRICGVQFSAQHLTIRERAAFARPHHTVSFRGHGALLGAGVKVSHIYVLYYGMLSIKKISEVDIIGRQM